MRKKESRNKGSSLNSCAYQKEKVRLDRLRGKVGWGKGNGGLGIELLRFSNKRNLGARSRFFVVLMGENIRQGEYRRVERKCSAENLYILAQKRRGVNRRKDAKKNVLGGKGKKSAGGYFCKK